MNLDKDKHNFGIFWLNPKPQENDSHEFVKKTFKFLSYSIALVLALNACTTLIPWVKVNYLALMMVLSPMFIAYLADQKITKD